MLVPQIITLYSYGYFVRSTCSASTYIHLEPDYIRYFVQSTVSYSYLKGRTYFLQAASRSVLRPLFRILLDRVDGVNIYTYIRSSPLAT